jgi:hypothetical protein
MPRPAKATIDALLELLDPIAVIEAARALELILAKQTERHERVGCAPTHFAGRTASA